MGEGIPGRFEHYGVWEVFNWFWPTEVVRRSPPRWRGGGRGIYVLVYTSFPPPLLPHTSHTPIHPATRQHPRPSIGVPSSRLIRAPILCTYVCMGVGGGVGVQSKTVKNKKRTKEVAVSHISGWELGFDGSLASIPSFKEPRGLMMYRFNFSPRGRDNWGKGQRITCTMCTQIKAV